MSPELEYYIPAIYCLIYYVFVFVLAEIIRNVVEKNVSPNTTLYVFLMEFIAVVQACTCVYENGIMLTTYNLAAGLFTITTLLFFLGQYTRGASINPLGPLEAAWNGVITKGRLITLLAAELAGAALAPMLAMNIWYYTSHLFDQHEFWLKAIPKCELRYKLDFPLVMAFEFFGCLLIRLVAPQISPRHKKYAIPAFIASCLITALVVVGVPGLNPVVATSRLYGCKGLDQNSFILLYWITPIAGCFTGAYLQRHFSVKAPKIIKKKTK